MGLPDAYQLGCKSPGVSINRLHVMPYRYRKYCHKHNLYTEQIEAWKTAKSEKKRIKHLVYRANILIYVGEWNYQTNTNISMKNIKININLKKDLNSLLGAQLRI
jgi:hypothetical protein